MEDNQKEKAKELVERFDNTLTYLESKNKAKQCALICVDEIRLELDNFGNDDGYQFSRVEYWQEVKQEINKL
jgi:hypothetical protein